MIRITTCRGATHLNRDGSFPGLDFSPEESPALPVGVRVRQFCLLLVGREDPSVPTGRSVDVQVKLVALLHPQETGVL